MWKDFVINLCKLVSAGFMCKANSGTVYSFERNEIGIDLIHSISNTIRSVGESTRKTLKEAIFQGDDYRRGCILWEKFSIHTASAAGI